VGFFAREQLKILLWRDGVFVAESVRFVIAVVVRCLRCGALVTHARQDRLVNRRRDGSRARWFGSRRVVLEACAN